ncbi:MAG: ATP-dependent DNA ligase [Verrucomicrobiota bacterium]|nr:ATP-dependent DNA ligase [Verrucomicrobiota bacterium]
MEALPVDEIPLGDAWQYEPKWDGFRCLAFREGAEVYLQSKAGQPLARYFPEMVEALRKVKADSFLLDGELAVPSDGGFSFDELLQRLHPAASRVKKLSSATPALLIVFDLLADIDGASLLELALAERRPRLEAFARRFFKDPAHLRLSPAVTSIEAAREWLRNVGPTLDGIIAKRRDLPYRSGDRTGMQKIKNYRSADCVVGGFRYAAGQQYVGSLLLGLYDEEGSLHHVGFTSGIKVADRAALTGKLEALIEQPGFTGRAPGGPSRWATGKSGDWKPLRATLVVEVSYDHFTGGRFRHGTKLLRWRPDKAPKQCTMDQVKRPPGDLLRLLEFPANA